MQIDYQIIHSIPGRFRILVPRLATDSDYARKLQELIESMKFVTEVRINALAHSLVVSYKTRAISSETVRQELVNAIEKADPAASSPTKETPKSSPVSESIADREKSGQASKAIVEETEVPRADSANDLVEDPWDLDLKEKSDSISPPTTEPTASETIALEREAMSVLSKPDKVEMGVPLSTADLAKRLQVTSQALTRYRSKPDFAKWTQAKDPEGMSWEYNLQSKTFYPIIFPANSAEVAP